MPQKTMIPPGTYSVSTVTPGELLPSGMREAYIVLTWSGIKAGSNGRLVIEQSTDNVTWQVMHIVDLLAPPPAEKIEGAGRAELHMMNKSGYLRANASITNAITATATLTFN